MSAIIGVILAGGQGTRLGPATARTNKHLLEIAGAPMIDHGVRTLVDAGFEDLVVVTGVQHADDFGAWLARRPVGAPGHVRLAFQARPAGVADALATARQAVGDHPAAVLLGDNLFGGGIRAHADAFREDPTGAQLVLTRSDAPGEFGYATLEHGRVIAIVEKPAVPPSPWVVAGLYFYGPGVFERCRSLVPSQRGELEISDLNASYVAQGQARAVVHPGWWADAGTPEGFARAESLLRERR